MRMLRKGEITINEVAQIALVSRQRVRVWCKNAGIDVTAARKAWLTPILLRMNRLDR